MSDETVNPTEETGTDTARTAAVEASELDHEQDGGPERRRTFSFGQMLIDAGVLSQEQVDAVQQASQRERLPFGQILVRDGLMVSRDLATLTALHLGLPLVDLRNETIDLDAVGRLPQEISQRYLVLAIRLTDSRLTVAMTDPSDFQTIQDLTTRTSCTIEPVIATPDDIQENLDLSYRAIEREAAQTFASGDGGRPTADTLRNSQPTEVVEAMLNRALQDRASDVHIEPSETRLRIRYRIDGVLHEVMNLPPEMHPAIMSRLKIMGGMNIAERRRPQDGQLRFETGDRVVDVRVAISPTVDGEMCVMRLLADQSFTLISLAQLGFTGTILEDFRTLLKLPYGMIIVCGPTGSGKSTTLYASVMQMNRVEQKIITIENPVEYHMPDCNQMQVQPEVGVTFASQLRSILRLDPDVIVVGEIRDQETAEIATEAALTGHLVLTTVHANDSVSALLRLQDLGVANYLLTSSVAGIIAQRMVRTVCRECKTSMTRPASERHAYAAELGEAPERFTYGTGCATCAQTGYHGRTGVYELLKMTDTIKQMFLEGASRDQLFKHAVTEGLIPLRRGGMLKVKDGITTPAEVTRVLFSL